MLDMLANRLQDLRTSLDWDTRDTLTEADVDAACRQVRRALLEADVNLRAIKSLLVRVKEKALGRVVTDSLSPEHEFISILHEELTALLGQDHRPLHLDTPSPAWILLFGLQGSGKTTTTGKLAAKLKAEGRRPLLVAADTVRPAAKNQLKQLGAQLSLPVFDLPDETDMVTIARAAEAHARQNGYDTLLVDTAGRQQVDTATMADLLLLERTLEPQEKLLVLDALMGQEAVAVAETFDVQLSLTGFVVTKVDSDARGGAILSIVEATGKPIKWVGTGEKLDALEPFHPERMASRILGMGDVLTLIERAKTAMDPAQHPDQLGEKLRNRNFNFNDFIGLQSMLGKLGPLEHVLGMLPIPGLTAKVRQQLAGTGEAKLKQTRIILDSMTETERENPDLLSSSRLRRIAKGCGKPLKDVEDFVQQFNSMRTMLQQMTQFMDYFSGEEDEPKPPPRQTQQGLALTMPGKRKSKGPKLPFPMPGSSPPRGSGPRHRPF